MFRNFFKSLLQQLIAKVGICKILIMKLCTFMQLQRNVYLKFPEMHLRYVLPSSCGIATEDMKISCGCPALNRSRYQRVNTMLITVDTHQVAIGSRNSHVFMLQIILYVIWFCLTSVQETIRDIPMIAMCFLSGCHCSLRYSWRPHIYRTSKITRICSRLCFLRYLLCV